MSRQISRNDTALHRCTHRQTNLLPVVAQGRLAAHLSIAAWKPLRALDELLRELEKTRCQVDRLIVLRARSARDQAWPYLTDEDGSVWR